MTRPLLGCIADDFTGATDLANNLVRQGMRTVQTIGVPDDDGEALDADAIVVALKSRTIPAAEAVRQSLHALRWLQARGVEQVYFKVCSTFDSTPAGNIGPVTDALLDALHGPGEGFTIACPAFPENRRTVYQGHLFVGDRLLSESGMQQHPLTPMTDPDLVRVMQAQTRRRVGLVARETVARGEAAVREAFAALRQAGVGVAIVDAVDDADLRVIGAAVRGMAMLTAGSGVATALPANWGLQASAGTSALPPAGGGRAVISGSCSAATRGQVAHALRAGLPALQIDALAVADGRDLVADALRLVAAAGGGAPLLVYATAEPAQVQAVQERLGATRAGELVEQALARIAAALVQGGVRQFVVAGGETSGAVVQALGVRRLRIGPQIDPGVPWTAAESPLCAGEPVHLALKSGNFGTPDFMTKAFDRLREVA